ncbi:MAG: hypothetical protein RJA07_59 [Bacteroidota bacterium]|jgi:2-polyprenyl-3-methyl-5-hydroxy-6-metoxy-1,4-benzoquinol methylase
MYLDKNNIWVTTQNQYERYPETGHDNSFNVEESSFWFKHRNNVITSTLKNYLVDGNIADIGGGNGLQAKWMSENFTNKKIYLVEPGYSGCLNAKKRGIEEVYNLLFEDFEFEKHKVEIITLFDVLEHIVSDEFFFKKLVKKLPVGGRLVITVPTYQWLWNDVDDFGKHARRYTLTELVNLGKKCELIPIYQSYFFGYLVIPTFILRRIPYLFGRKRTDEEIVKAESKQHNSEGVLDKIFQIFNKKEITTIQKKQAKQFGASCIVVFQK